MRLEGHLQWRQTPRSVVSRCGTIGRIGREEGTHAIWCKPWKKQNQAAAQARRQSHFQKQGQTLSDCKAQLVGVTFQF